MLLRVTAPKPWEGAGAVQRVAARNPGLLYEGEELLTEEIRSSSCGINLSVWGG